MNVERFWEIIEQSKSALNEIERDGNFERQAEFIKDHLMQLPKNDIAAFAKIFHHLSQELYTWDLWGAAYIMGGGCSDDSFSDFRGWIISLGREAYELALTNPDELGPMSKALTVEDVFFEELAYVADEVMDEAFEEELDLELDFRAEPRGDKWNENEVESLYPKLAAIYA